MMLEPGNFQFHKVAYRGWATRCDVSFRVEVLVYKNRINDLLRDYQKGLLWVNLVILSKDC